MTRLVLLFFLYSSFISIAQEIGVKNVQTAEWPKIKADLWFRNPEGTSRTVEFIEDGVKTKIDLPKEFAKNDSAAKNKAIIFVILYNDPSRGGLRQFEWHRKVLKETINKINISKGDKIGIYYFNNERGGRLLFPNDVKFTDDKAELLSRLDNLSKPKPIYERNKCSTLGTNLVLHAANEAMEILETNTTKSLARGVFILADDKVCEATHDTEAPYAKAKRNNIAVYGLTYYARGANNYTKKLCTDSYGEYYVNTKNDPNDAIVKMVGFLNDFSKRHAGVIYSVEYTTPNEEKNSTNRQIKVECEDQKTEFILNSPDKSFTEKIKDNLLWIILGILVLAFIVYGIVYYNKKKKQEQAAMDQMNAARLQEIENKRQQDAQARENEDRQIQQKLNQIERLELQRKEEERRIQEENERARRKSEQQVQNDVLVAQMREKGNFPWIEFSGPNGHGRFEIDQPTVIFGRDASQCDFALQHPTVSKKHFTIYFRNYKYFLKDLNSTNGTFHNSYKISEVQLQHGDVIHAGDITITFHI
jgi:hypothetical protein